MNGHDRRPVRKNEMNTETESLTIIGNTWMLGRQVVTSARAGCSELLLTWRGRWSQRPCILLPRLVLRSLNIFGSSGYYTATLNYIKSKALILKACTSCISKRILVSLFGKQNKPFTNKIQKYFLTYTSHPIYKSTASQQNKRF
jgi:hypothetical protein